MTSQAKGTEDHIVHNSTYGMSRKGVSTDTWNSIACLKQAVMFTQSCDYANTTKLYTVKVNSRA